MSVILPAQRAADAPMLEAQLDPARLPQHTAVIMDGNGRWGVGRGLSRSDGHRESIEAIRRTVTCADDLKLRYLSLYCFSTENVNRPAAEVHGLFDLFADVLDTETDELHRKQVRIVTTGMLELLPPELYDKFRAAEERTAQNPGLTLNLCVMYSGRSELIEAVKKLARAAAQGELDPERINERSFRGYLFRPEIPDPDLVVRSSGEVRISNFLLWQIAYSELVFTEVLWPDFSRADFLAALLTYQQRSRRFGKV
jgi:undecaprenyl diphosphate synthase